MDQNFTRSVRSWYDAGHRDLPWRHTKDAYRIWISEIMLQQTRAETVVSYYERFLARYPDVYARRKRSCSRRGRDWGITAARVRCKRRQN